MSAVPGHSFMVVPSTPKPMPLVVPMRNAQAIAEKRCVRLPLRNSLVASFQSTNAATAAGTAIAMAMVVGSQPADTIA